MIITLCVVPLNTKGELNHITIAGIRGDHFFHCLMFIPFLPITWFGGLDKRKKNNLFLLILAGLLLAVFAESLQIFIPYRTFTLKDVAANCMGVLIGSFLAFLIKRGNK